MPSDIYLSGLVPAACACLQERHGLPSELMRGTLLLTRGVLGAVLHSAPGQTPAVAAAMRLATSRAGAVSMASRHVPTVLFVECGFGCDQHGQTATKAAVRACRNAIEFNSLPRIGKLVPGGYEAMKLHVQLGVPEAYVHDVDEEAVKAVFPYGDCKVDLEAGGLLADSGIALEAMGDKNRDMIIAVACVTVGYDEPGEA